MTRAAAADEPREGAVTAVELRVRLSFDAGGPPADVATVRVTGSAADTEEGIDVDHVVTGCHGRDGSLDGCSESSQRPSFAVHPFRHCYKTTNWASDTALGNTEL